MSRIAEALRIAVVVAAIAVVVGVAGCSNSRTRSDPEAFCRSRKTWVCARSYAAAMMCAGAEPFTTAQYDECRSSVASDCAGAMWSPGCGESASQTAACLDALSRAENVCIPESMISECNLCTGP